MIRIMADDEYVLQEIKELYAEELTLLKLFGSIPELKATATRMYHYYMYFSQYEHFSENGQGDVLESAKDDGNDNIHLPSAIKALSDGVEEVMNHKRCHRL